MSSTTAGNTSAPSTVISTDQNDNKQFGPHDASTQAVKTTGSSAQDTAGKNRFNNDGSDPTTMGPLKNLQQRLSAVRRSTTPGMAAMPDPHPSLDDNTPRLPSRATVMAAADANMQQSSDMSPMPTMAAPIGPAGPAAGTMSQSLTDRTPSVVAAKMPSATPSTDMAVPTQTFPLPTMAVDAASDSPAISDVRANPLSDSVADAVRSKPMPTRSNAPVVSIAMPPSAATELSRAAHHTVPAASPDFNVPVSEMTRETSSSRGASTPEGVLFAHQSPVLEVETTGPRSVCVGKEANYCVSIANTGELPAQNVEVSIKTPEWSEVLRTKVSNGETVMASNKRGEPLVWRLPRLESHAKEQLNVRLVPRESQSFDLIVQWACSPAMSKSMVEVREPKIALTLDGPSELLFGQTKVYKLTMSNPGNGDAENVVLLLAPVDGGAGAPTRHEIGLIRAGETKPVEVELSARQAGKLSIKATAVADGNLKSEVAEDILVRRAGLKTTVTGPELKFAGTPVTYDVVVSNPGNCTAENIRASAVLPPSAKFVAAPGGQYSEEENKITWTVPSLRAGAEQELQLTCTLNSPGTNRVQVLATAAGDLNDNVSTSTNVEALADLKLEVVDPPGPLAVGEEIIYEVHVRNRGTKAAENVDVAGFFSNGIEPINAQGAPNQIAPGQIVFRPIATIAAGSETVLRIKARADQPGNHVFRTEVSCPSVGAKLATEETTLFYGDGHTSDERIAARPATTGQIIPASDSSAPAVAR